MKMHFPGRILFLTAGAAALLWLAAYLTLYSLGALLGHMGGILGAETAALLGDIFSALRTAQLRPSSLALFVIGALYLLLALLCGKPRLTAALSPLFLITGYITAIWFASVNGIRFGDVILSLANAVGNGLFDIL